MLADPHAFDTTVLKHSAGSRVKVHMVKQPYDYRRWKTRPN